LELIIWFISTFLPTSFTTILFDQARLIHLLLPLETTSQIEKINSTCQNFFDIKT
jgi:hypothetical protein